MLRAFSTFYIIVEIILIIFVLKFQGLEIYAAEVLISGILGLALIFKFGILTFFDEMRSFSTKSIFRELGIAMGGAFLFLPGILSEIIGATFIIVSLFLKKHTQPNFTQNFGQNAENKGTFDESEIIDVEIIEERK